MDLLTDLRNIRIKYLSSERKKECEKYARITHINAQSARGFQFENHQAFSGNLGGVRELESLLLGKERKSEVQIKVGGVRDSLNNSVGRRRRTSIQRIRKEIPT